MNKTLRGILMLVLLAVFTFSAGMVVVIKAQYKASEKRYEDAAARFTSAAVRTENALVRPSAAPTGGEDPTEPEDTYIPEYAPITVDFETLQAVNPEVIGWIYCEDTVINYPIVHGTDNDYYLEHSYNRTYDPSGTIFSDAANAPGFTDPSVILYGHHMQNMTMFATIKYWFQQEYYEAHPVMWLLTPEQDYKIVLMCGYVTSALSDTYTVFHEHGPEFETYLQDAMSRSEFQSGLEPDPQANYVMLSTCAYVFDYARSVMHGQLVPLDSAGGVPFAEYADRAD